MSPVAVWASAKTFYFSPQVAMLAVERRPLLRMHFRAHQLSLLIRNQLLQSLFERGAREFITKRCVFIYQDEALSTSGPSVSAQSLPVGPVPLGHGSTSMVQSKSIAFETIKGRSTAIREGITLPRGSFLLSTVTLCTTMVP